MRIDDRERWELLDRLFDQALSLPPVSWPDFLADRCRGDADLRRQLEALLTAEREAAAFLGESVGAHLGADARTLLARVEEELGGAGPGFAPGDRVGPWRIEGRLGEGGMARVYRAVRADGEMERPVALKVVKRGLDTEDVVARFRRERRILASLDHPSIARLYDGGVTDDGRPYLVMEVVEGRPLTRYCTEEDLSVPGRVRLLIQVCRALESAHARLVVHRDLKPSNVLVTDGGVPKLLDFGIAKLLEDGRDADGPRTRTGVRVLTPEYAAPEQILGQPVTTGTDLHGVGLLLYELVAERRAFGSEARGPRASEEAVLEGVPEPASRVHSGSAPRRLLRDLDGVIERCLAKAPEDRYRSAGEVASDLEAALEGRPLVARPLGVAGRTLRTLRRNWLPASAAAGLVALLAGVAVWSNVQRARVEAALAVAEEERATAEEVTEFVTDMFASSDPFPSGARRDTLPVAAFLGDATREVREELGARPAVQASLLATLGRLRMSLGGYAEAEDLLSEALAVARTLPETPGKAERLTSALVLLGGVYQRTGRAAEAEPLLREVIALRRAETPGGSTSLAGALGNLGSVIQDQGRLEEARPLYDSATAMARRQEPLDTGTLLSLLNARAALAYRVGELDEAVTTFEELVPLQRSRLGPDHPAVAREVQNLAFLHLRTDRPEEAIPGFEEALRILEDALGPGHPQVAVTRGNLAEAYGRVGRVAEAETAYRRSVEAQRRAGTGRQAASTMLSWGSFRLDRGDVAGARELVEEAHGELVRLLGPDHPQTALARGRMGRARCLGGAPEQGREDLAASRALLESTEAGERRFLADVAAWQEACEGVQPTARP